MSLKDAYSNYFKMGVAVNPIDILLPPAKALIKREYNSITCENNMSKTEYDALEATKPITCPDCDELQVIDESTTPHKVVAYCVAFNGHWCFR